MKKLNFIITIAICLVLLPGILAEVCPANNIVDISDMPCDEITPIIQDYSECNVTIIEINAEPTPLTRDGVSDYLIQGKTGEILPRILKEVKRLRE